MDVRCVYIKVYIHIYSYIYRHRYRLRTTVPSYVACTTYTLAARRSATIQAKASKLHHRSPAPRGGCGRTSAFGWLDI